MSDRQGGTEENDSTFPLESSIEVVGKKDVVYSIGDGDVDQRVVDKQYDEGGNAEDPLDGFLAILRWANWFRSKCLEQCTRHGHHREVGQSKEPQDIRVWPINSNYPQVA